MVSNSLRLIWCFASILSWHQYCRQDANNLLLIYCKGKNFIDMDILQTVWVSLMYNSCYDFILKTLNFYLLIYKRLAKEGFLTVFFLKTTCQILRLVPAHSSVEACCNMLTHFINKILSFDNSFLIHTLTTMKRNNLELEDDCASVRVRSHTAGC